MCGNPLTSRKLEEAPLGWMFQQPLDIQGEILGVPRIVISNGVPQETPAGREVRNEQRLSRQSVFVSLVGCRTLRERVALVRDHSDRRSNEYSRDQRLGYIVLNRKD